MMGPIMPLVIRFMVSPLSAYLANLATTAPWNGTSSLAVDIFAGLVDDVPFHAWIVCLCVGVGLVV
jgi:hypothetical protein